MFLNPSFLLEQGLPGISLHCTGQANVGSPHTLISKHAKDPLLFPVGGVEKHRLVVANSPAVLISLGRAHPPKPYRVRPWRLRA